MPQRPATNSRYSMRRELVVDHRLVRHPGHDPLGRDRIGQRVDAEHRDRAGVGREQARDHAQASWSCRRRSGRAGSRTRRRARSGRGRRPPAGRSAWSARGFRGRRAGVCWFMGRAFRTATLVERSFRPVNQKTDEIVRNFNGLRPGRGHFGARDEGVGEKLVLPAGRRRGTRAGRPGSSPARRRRRPGSPPAADGPPARPCAPGCGGCRARARRRSPARI